MSKIKTIFSSKKKVNVHQLGASEDFFRKIQIKYVIATVNVTRRERWNYLYKKVLDESSAFLIGNWDL